MDLVGCQRRMVEFKLFTFSSLFANNAELRAVPSSLFNSLFPPHLCIVLTTRPKGTHLHRKPQRGSTRERKQVGRKTMFLRHSWLLVSPRSLLVADLCYVLLYLTRAKHQIAQSNDIIKRLTTTKIQIKSRSERKRFSRAQDLPELMISSAPKINLVYYCSWLNELHASELFFLECQLSE